MTGFGGGTFGGGTFGSESDSGSPWEEVYGSDHPLTPDDVPLLQNGVCRVQYEQATAVFSLHLYDEFGYVEAGRFSIHHDDDGQRYSVLRRPFVAEWTPERAVIGAIFALPDPSVRCCVYLTLQRGWTGPRVELYPAWHPVTPKPGVIMRLVPAAAGTTELGLSSGPATITDDADYGTFAALEPWAYLLGQSPNPGLHVAVLQEEASLTGRTDSIMYGEPRDGVSLASPAAVDYLSATLGIGARADVADDAETLGSTNLLDCRAVPMLVER